MARARLLGVFEDAAQRDFHLGVVYSTARRLEIDIEIYARLTHGCRFEYLAEFISEAQCYSGTVVAVDGKKRREQGKIRALEQGIGRFGVATLPQPLLWSVASPSVEEWMMADPEAVPRTLRQALGVRVLRHAPRPGRAAAERTAKMRLAQWTTDLLGARLLQGGREYAEAIGQNVDPSRVGQSRNPDLKVMLEKKLPAFLASLRPAEDSDEVGRR